jgi:amino acid adenylation domain-containing protein
MTEQISQAVSSADKSFSQPDKKSDLAPALELPADYPHSDVSPSVRDSVSVATEPEMTDQIKQFCRGNNIDLSILLAAAFKVFLYRYTGQHDIVINTVNFSGSVQNNLNHLVLSLHTRLEDDLCVTELLERVQQTQKNNNNNPAKSCRIMLILYDASVSPDSEPEHVCECRNDSDLAVITKESEDWLQISFDYNTGLFSRSTVERFLGNFKELLANIVNDPQEHIARVPLLTKDELNQVLVEWNNTEVEYPQDKCIHQLFEEQVEKTPDAVAVVFQEQELTYQELNRRSNQLAHYLQKLAAGPDTSTGIFIERSLEMVVGILGILKAGAAYVPIDPAYPDERISYLLENSQVQVLLTLKHQLVDLPEYQGQILCLDTDWDSIAAGNEENPTSEVQPTNLAYIMYTSGSTGKPKGVLVPHQGLCNLAWDQIRFFDVQPTSRYLQFASLSFDPSISDIITSLCAGARLCLIPPESSRLGSELKELLQQYEITHIDIVPPALATISSEELPALRVVIVGGDVCTQELVREWSKGRLFINTYGPTECTVSTTAVRYTDSNQKPTIGRPISNTQIYILDRFLQPVPIGVIGELYIGGVGVARGYLNRPEITVESFLHDPFSEKKDARMYKTGDLARYQSNGEIEFLGRVDYQIKIRGNRIELAEIETALEKHPQVDQSVVLAFKNPAGDKQLAAYTVSSVSHPESNNLREFLKKMLPDYMIPAVFISLDAFPLTPNGKVDRKALPEPEQIGQQTDYIAPQDILEQQIAELWENILHRKRIGMYDNFFDLGGNSLLAATLFAEIEKKFGKRLPLLSLLKAATVRSLAELLRKDGVTPSKKTPVLLQPEGKKAPFFYVPPGGCTALNGIPYTRYLGTDQPIYGLQPSGFEEGETPHDNIRELASYYIKEMKKVQPEGPYYFGGPCFGAHVVFEMACQFQAQGCAVGLAAMLDPPDPSVPLLDRNIYEKTGYYLRKLYYYAGYGQLTSAFMNFFVHSRYYRIRSKFLMIKNKILRQENRAEYVLAAHTAAMDNYRPDFYPGKITLFENSEAHILDRQGEQYRSAKRWEDFSAELDNRVIKGSHLEIFEEPIFSKFVRELKHALDEAQVAHRSFGG